MSRRQWLGLLRPGGRAVERAATPSVAPAPRSREESSREVAPPWQARAAAPRLPPSLVPQVVASRCLSRTSFCTVCVERCASARAIELVQGVPVVDAARCDGCGQCMAACPAPVLAFSLVPR